MLPITFALGGYCLHVTTSLTTRTTIISALASTLLALAGSCVIRSDDIFSGDCQAGTHGCACTADGSCDDGLSCVAGTCIDNGGPLVPSHGDDSNESATSTGSEDHEPSEDESSNGETGDETSGIEPDVMTGKVDVVIVVDNSISMGHEQANLALAMPALVRKLRSLTDEVQSVALDVQLMVTTTDLGHADCGNTTPEMGNPVGSGCNARLASFVAHDGTDHTRACTEVCPADVVPLDGDPIVRFAPGEHNVPNVDDTDIDGDGEPDDAVAQALACLAPQGVDGCGHESPLEAMFQAINPHAAHNTGEAAFLRDDAVLGIVVVTDEPDCSYDVEKNPSLFDENGDLDYWEVDPRSGLPAASSAICWNAGTRCTSNGDGTYECRPRVDELRKLDRYLDYLAHLIHDEDKEVVMLGLWGVPQVQAYADVPPYEPKEGGVHDLVYRDWRDGLYPDGDILPDDWHADPIEDAAYKTFKFGIGPGCTGQTSAGDFTGQASPPVRLRQVCEALDGPASKDVPRDLRCCMDSICADDFGPAFRCFASVLGQAVARMNG